MKNGMTAISVMAMAVSAVLLSGCGKEPPKCSDQQTFSLVRDILVDSKMLGGAGNLEKKDIESFMWFKNPVATGYNKDIKKYSCTATLVIKSKGVTLDTMGDDEQWENGTVQYTSQLDDNNDHIVSLSGFQGNPYFLASKFKALKENKEDLVSKSGIGKAEGFAFRSTLKESGYFNDPQSLREERSGNPKAVCMGKEGGNDLIFDAQKVVKMYRAHHAYHILEFDDGKWCYGYFDE